MSKALECLAVVAAGLAFGFVVITIGVYGLVAMVEAASKGKDDA
jgi:hypothetical protein